jgi:hypothetical protein
VKHYINLHLERKSFATNMRNKLLPWLSYFGIFGKLGMRFVTLFEKLTRTCHKILAHIDLIREHLFKRTMISRCNSNEPIPKRSPPPRKVLLINSDAAIFESSGRMGAAWLALWLEITWAVLCLLVRHQLPGLAPPEEAEASALKRAVLLGQEDGHASSIGLSFAGV